MKRSRNCIEILRPLAEQPVQCYLSNTLQVADLLQWILGQTGPAEIRLTSFSISEEFLRRLFFIRKTGLIVSTEILLDFKATNKTLLLWPFIAQTVENCRLADNHSKILLVVGAEMKVSVIMSQNLTRGNRFEAGFISTDTSLFDSLSSELDSVISTHSVSFHEIYSRTIEYH